VQFVKFSDYQSGKMGISALAEEVLKEMPDQIVGYMMTHGIQPNKVQWANVDEMVMHP
jgi:hypothetical protein